MATLPSSLALTNIADGASAVAADHRNNFSAIQTEANALITILGAGTAGDVFTGVGTTVQYAKPPGYEYAYTEVTANTTITATTEGTATTVVTASAVTFDGSTVVKIEFYSPIVETGATAGDQVLMVLYEDGASIGQFGNVRAASSGNVQAPAKLERRRTPASGSRTYSVRAFKAGTNNGVVYAGLGGNGALMPAFIRITKV